MKVKVASPIRFYNGEKLVGESNYNGNAFADPHIEIMEDDIVKGYKAAGDEIVKAWNDFDGYIDALEMAIAALELQKQTFLHHQKENDYAL